MKLKVTLFSISLLFPIVILSDPYDQKAAEWKGKIEIKDGAEIISNPTEPHYGEIKLKLEEDLSIGNEEDENYLFYRIKDIQVDTYGNIYVLDSGNNRIQVFDKEGQYLRTIGKGGQGPGELNALIRLQVDEAGHIHVADRTRKIVVFDEEGRYLDKDIHLVDYLLDFYLDSDNCVWGKFFLPGTEKRFIRKVTAKGKIETTIAEIPFYINRVMFPLSKVNNTAYARGYFFTHGYEYDIYISKLDNHRFVYGYSKEYKLVIFDEAREILFTIKKQETPKQIIKTEKERIVDLTRRDIAKRGMTVPEMSIEFPTHTPYFYSIITDDQSRIYVRTNLASLEPNIDHEYDLFNKEGLYLYKIRSSSYLDVIRDGYLYTRIVSEDTGMEQIRRYKINNWNQIRAGI